MPLELCGGDESGELDGEDVGGEGEGEGGKAWRWTGAASPIVWCPASPSQDQESDQQLNQQRRRRRLGDQAATKVANSPSPGEAEELTESILTKRGWGDGGGDIFGGTELTDSEPQRGWETEMRRGHRGVPKIVKGGSAADAGAAAAAGMPGEWDGKRRRRSSVELGSTGRGGGRRLLRSDQTGVVDEGAGGVETIEGGLAGRREEEGQGAGGKEEVEKDEGGENKEEKEEDEGGGEHENPEDEGHPTEKQEEEEEEEREDKEDEDEEEGNMEAREGAVRLAWIPGDPCSCVNSPGMVGEACRGWLMARVPSSPSRGDQSAQAEVRVVGWRTMKPYYEFGTFFVLLLFCFVLVHVGGGGCGRWLIVGRFVRQPEKMNAWNGRRCCFLSNPFLLGGIATARVALLLVFLLQCTSRNMCGRFSQERRSPCLW